MKKITITFLSWLAGVLSGWFPSVFYVEVFLKDPKKRGFGHRAENVNAVVWHPLWMGRLFKKVGVEVEFVRESRF